MVPSGNVGKVHLQPLEDPIAEQEVDDSTRWSPTRDQVPARARDPSSMVFRALAMTGPSGLKNP